MKGGFNEVNNNRGNIVGNNNNISGNTNTSSGLSNNSSSGSNFNSQSSNVGSSGNNGFSGNSSGNNRFGESSGNSGSRGFSSGNNGSSVRQGNGMNRSSMGSNTNMRNTNSNTNSNNFGNGSRGNSGTNSGSTTSSNGSNFGNTLTTGNNNNNSLFGDIQLIGEITFGKVIFFLIILYVILMIAYLLSQNYRVNSTINQLDKYSGGMLLDSTYLMKNQRKKKTLKEFHVASSFRPYLAINQLLEYSSERLITRNVQNGVRCMFFDIFNDTLDEDAYPVISSGYEKGNWKLTLNTLRFETVMKELSKTIFNSGFAPNYNDPFILLLNLKTNRNHKCVNRIQQAIYKYFKDKLLPSKYSYQSRNIADAPLRDLMGRLVIITSQGYENSNLEEIINGSWNTEHIKKISYKSLDTDTPKSDAIKLNIDDVKIFNNTSLSIVVPEEDSFFTYNYDPSPFFTARCQFIFMNYQLNNTYMEPYITKFKKSSFVEM